MKKIDSLLTKNEQTLLLFIIIFAFIGLLIRYTGLIADEKVNSADSLNFSIDHQIKYDLQNVTKEELISIPGIGEKKAGDILRYKKEKGFRAKTDLMSIKGIGEKTFKKIEKYFYDIAAGDENYNYKIENSVEIIRSDKININTADKNELTKITGIGPSKAGKILAYREKIGKFENIDELLLVKGIGEKTLEKIKEEITLGE